MKRLILVLCLLAGSFLLSVTPSWACGYTGASCALPAAEDDGVGYHYDSISRVLHPEKITTTTGTETTKSGSTWQTKYVRSCGVVDQDSLGPISTCANLGCTVDGESAYLTTIMRRQSGGDAWEKWPGRTNECWLGGQDDPRPVPIERIEIEITEIIEEHYKRIARPTVTLQPETTGIVNLPVIASTDDQGTVAFTITTPISGRVEASPTYEWAWSNGTTSSGPGRPYDDTNPATDPGHYPVQATYTAASQGSVTLTATWEITLTLDGMPAITDIEPLVYEETADFGVRNARSVLVD